MGIQGNSFGLLGLDDSDDLESLIARAAGVKIDEPPSAVEKRPNNNRKRLPSSQSPPQFQSKPPRSSDHVRSEEKRENIHGSERPHKNGVTRYNGRENGSDGGFGRLNNGFRQENGQGEGFKNGSGGGFGRRNNGFRKENGQGEGFKRYDRRTNSFQKDEQEKDGNGEPNARRPHSAANESDVNLQAPNRNNGFRTERGYGQRRGYNRDYDNGYEVGAVEHNKQQTKSQGNEGGSVGDFQNENKTNNYRNERQYRSRNWNSDGRDLRGNAGFHRGYKSDEGKTGGWVRRGNRGGNQEYRHENSLEKKNDGKIDESSNDGKGSEKDSGVAGTTNGVEGNAVAAEASKGTVEWKKGGKRKELSQEEIEKLAAEEEAEAKKMTLKDYEEHLQEKRKVLESMKKSEERKVMPDKDFESMHVIDNKKNEEGIFVKLGNDGDKTRKKVIADKDDNSHMSIVPNFKPAGINYPERRGGRYQENSDGVYSGRGDRGGYGNEYSRRMKKTEAPPSFEDTNQFPALGGSARGG